MTTHVLTPCRCSHPDVRLYSPYPGFWSVVCGSCYDGENVTTSKDLDDAIENWNDAQAEREVA